MGERWLCKPEVIGSIPFSSTEPKRLCRTPRPKGLALFIDKRIPKDERT